MGYASDTYEINLYKHGEGSGIVILLLVLASVPLILKAQFRVLLLTGFLSAFVGVWVLEYGRTLARKRALACAVQRIPRWILGGKQLGLVGSARWCRPHHDRRAMGGVGQSGGRECVRTVRRRFSPKPSSAVIAGAPCPRRTRAPPTRRPNRRGYFPQTLRWKTAFVLWGAWVLVRLIVQPFLVVTGVASSTYSGGTFDSRLMDTIYHFFWNRLDALFF